MYIKSMVRECDMTGEKFDVAVEGAGIVVRGATGRWCVVLECGPAYLAGNSIVPEDEDVVRARIDGAHDGDYADF
jgi:hypothetical protein